MRTRKKSIRGFTLIEMTVVLTLMGMVLGAINVYALFMRRQIVTRAAYLYPRVELASVYADLRTDIQRARRAFGYPGRIFQDGALWQAGPVRLGASLTSATTPEQFLIAASLTNEARPNTYSICLLDGTGQASVWLLTRDTEGPGLRYRVSWWRYQGLGHGSIEFLSNGYTPTFQDQPVPAVTEDGSTWKITLPNPAFTYPEFLQGGTPTQAEMLAPKIR